MKLPWFKRKPSADETGSDISPTSPPASGAFTWDDQARQGVEQALQQAPVPKLLKGRVKKELKKAAEEAATKAGRTNVTIHDVMNGMLAKMPPHMRAQVEKAMQGGPDEVKKLQRRFRGKM